MDKQLRYTGEFLSCAGVLWRAELWQDADTPYQTIGQFHFPANNPLEIEWKETDKLESVQASCATLTVVSKVDRQYKDLYTVEVGSISLKVFREDILYWCGTMDTELYEEPFSYESEYEVSMTFSDFGMLERLSYANSGIQTFEQIVMECVQAVCLPYIEMQYYISTSLGKKENLLAAISIQCANFYDEDEEAMTLRAVLDEVLRPLALRLVQRAGQLFIYDLNAVQTMFEPEDVRWEREDGCLSVDKVYNKVKLKFSVYDKKEALGVTAHLDRLDYATVGVSTFPFSGIIYKSYPEIPQGSIFPTGDPGFKIEAYRNNPEITGVELDKRADLFKITPICSGEECEGVLWRVNNVFSTIGTINKKNPTDAYGSVLLKIKKRFILPINVSVQRPSLEILEPTRTDPMLKINMGIMLDGRYNPFENVGKQNSLDNNIFLKFYFAVFIPIRLRLYDIDGKVLKHYENTYIKGDRLRLLENPLWVDGDYTDEECAFMPYYDVGNMNKRIPLGWMEPFLWNSANLSNPNKFTSGVYVSIPYIGKYVELDFEVRTGIYCNTFPIGFNLKDPNIYHNDLYPYPNNPYDKYINWLLYRFPEITLVNLYGKVEKGEDIEYTSWINTAAKEELKIDTVVGSADEMYRQGLGLMLESTSLRPIRNLDRANFTAPVEKLLLGTVYSNYHRRMNVLSGTVRLLNGFGLYTDRNEKGTYLLLSDVQNLIEDESEIKMVEVEPDNYEGVNYE